MPEWGMLPTLIRDMKIPCAARISSMAYSSSRSATFSRRASSRACDVGANPRAIRWYRLLRITRSRSRADRCSAGWDILSLRAAASKEPHSAIAVRARMCVSVILFSTDFVVSRPESDAPMRGSHNAV